MAQTKVVALSLCPEYSFSKLNQNEITLLKGLGVKGDIHSGKTVKHRSRIRKNADSPNLRQVHLIQSELHEELKQKGYEIVPGQMGENITTIGINLLNLPQNAILKIGEAVIKVTGLRNPCSQLDSIKKGLMKDLLDRDPDGNLIRKAGIMGIVMEGGTIRVGQNIEIILPEGVLKKLEPV